MAKTDELIMEEAGAGRTVLERETVADDTGAGLVDLLLVLATHKWWVSGLAAAGGLIAALIVFQLPNTYTATAMLLPPQQQQATAATMLGQLGPLAAAAAHDMGLKSPGDLYVGLLGSRTIADHVIERFRLMPLYKAKTMVDARSKLRSHARFSTGKDSLVKLEVDDIDPNRAAAMANLFISELNKQNTGFGTNEASQRRMFLEKQVNDEKETLAAAEDAMKTTQAKTGIIQVESQTSLSIASVAQLKAEITSGEVSLARLKMGATPENPEVLKAEAQLSILRSELRKSVEQPRSGNDPMVSTSTLPNSGLEYMRSLRDLKYHEFLFEMLSKQYEAARIDEARAVPALQVVDMAVPPDKKSGPHRALLTVVGMLLGAILGAVIAYLRNSEGDPVFGRKLRALFCLLTFRGGSSVDEILTQVSR